MVGEGTVNEGETGRGSVALPIAATWLPLVAIEHNGDWAIVDNLHLHVRPKHAG